MTFWSQDSLSKLYVTCFMLLLPLGLVVAYKVAAVLKGHLLLFKYENQEDAIGTRHLLNLII